MELGFETWFEGYRCFVIHLTNDNLDCLKSVQKDYDILIPYIFNDKAYTVNLHSSSVDVSKIARKYGGKGNSRVAGFCCKQLPFDINRRNSKMKEQTQNNKLEIVGKIESDIEFSHNHFNEDFYSFKLKVPRLSDESDILKCIASKQICDGFNKDDDVYIGGEFRSFNNYSGVGAKLLLTVFIKEMAYASVEQSRSSLNDLELNAYICKKPVLRKTPFGREIADLLLAVNRRFNKSDYIPAICWGRSARAVQEFEVGDNVICKGRIQSREYKKTISEDQFEIRIAYELSINSISKVGE